MIYRYNKKQILLHLYFETRLLIMLIVKKFMFRCWYFRVSILEPRYIRAVVLNLFRAVTYFEEPQILVAQVSVMANFFHAPWPILITPVM